MVDKNILAAHGCTAEAWKKLLIVPDPPVQPKKGKKAPPPPKEKSKDEEARERLCERIKNRLTNGREQNTKNFGAIRACDLLWDTPFRQVSPTLLASIADNCKTSEEQYQALKLYGFDLNKAFITETDPKTKQEVKKLNVPLFFGLMIPYVHGMVRVRRAKLFNDRNRMPFFDYPPAVNSRKHRLQTSAVKSRMSTMSQQYNYPEYLNQALLHMLLYPAACLMFTQEAWHWEEQLRKKTGKSDDKKKKGKSDYETYVTKEGLRYFIPHPARCFFDRSHPVKTFNTETGCDWAAHWRVIQYKELTGNTEFYNVDKIPIGDTNWWTSNAAFLNTFFGSCVITAPSMPAAAAAVNERDREQFLETHSYYGQNNLDHSICLFEYRERLCPKDEGLGSYPHKVWARFVCAGDGTIVFAEPLSYRAVLALKENGDEKRMEDASLALRLAPFQDQMSNVVSQYLLSVKQNLANITLFDEDVINDPKAIDKVMNLGEGWFRGLNMQKFSGKRSRVARENVGGAIYSHRFPQLDTTSLMIAVRSVIELAERVEQFSNTEIGQQASHEQSAKEIVSLAGTTSNILQYTGSPVDQFMHAWGTQIYEAWINEGDDEFTAEIPYDESVDKKVLEDLGFEFVEEPEPMTGRAHVKGRKSKVLPNLLSFAMLPNSTERKTDEAMARILVEWTRDLLNNPMMAQAIGPDQAIALQNAIAKLAGIPLDAPLRNTGMTPEQQAEQSRAQLAKLVDQVKAQFGQEVEGRVMSQVQQGLVPMLQHDKQIQMRVDLIWQLLRLPPINGSPGPQGGAPSAVPATSTATAGMA